MSWQPIAPQELNAGSVIRVGTLPARVTGWSWRADRIETVVLFRYTQSAPLPYRGAPGSAVFARDEDALVWRPD